MKLRAGRSKVRPLFHRYEVKPVCFSKNILVFKRREKYRHELNKTTDKHLVFFLWIFSLNFNNFAYFFKINSMLLTVLILTDEIWFVSFDLAKMRIHEIISILEWTPIVIFCFAGILAAAACECGWLFRRWHMLLQRHKSISFGWRIMSVIDAGCIDLISILFTLRHFCFFDKSGFAAAPNGVNQKISRITEVLVELINLNCTSILPSLVNLVWVCDELMTQGTNWICVNTRNSRWLPEFPVRDPFRDPRFLRNLFDENITTC